jgi:hypothetical protein
MLNFTCCKQVLRSHRFPSKIKMWEKINLINVNIWKVTGVITLTLGWLLW